jgi:hypothetical protein
LAWGAKLQAEEAGVGESSCENNSWGLWGLQPSYQQLNTTEKFILLQ